MDKITPLKNAAEKTSIWHRISDFLLNISNILEMLILILLWVLIFSNTGILGGFTRQEIIAYILIGNTIGLISGYFLHRLIAGDINDKSSKLLLYKPLKYFRHIMSASLGRNILPFAAALALNLLFLYFFLDTIPINIEIAYIFTIIIMIVLAFIIEFLIAYIAKLFIFWTIESGRQYRLIVRIKKFLAGAYFPLTLLPPALLSVSLILPFSYSFYVPTQLYLKKIDLHLGLQGLIVQIVWIMVLYAAIQIIWSQKIKKQMENNK
ncbi:hypothetical protein DRH27_05160 [Candidatus Falkowbacteria bacterium]|nr:MAG: hypothetical protein DRH27_05160 [Candidatus Falkowbacteria bacterium]